MNAKANQLMVTTVGFYFRLHCIISNTYAKKQGAEKELANMFMFILLYALCSVLNDRKEMIYQTEL